MPKPRGKPGTQTVENRIFILCEGKPGKSEFSYYSDLIKSLNLPKNRVHVQLVKTNTNTGRELVREGARSRKVAADIVWVAYDKDGYTKHPETFELARQKNVGLAFSSICFEFWILLHYEYTSRPFASCSDLLHYLKQEHEVDCAKGTKTLFRLCGDRLSKAIVNAKAIETAQLSGNPEGTPLYEINPITTVHHLVADLTRFQSL